MRPLSGKQISLSLGVSESKSSQAMRPALSKVAACLLLFPAETLAELNVAANMLQRQWMIDGEWDYRLSLAMTMRADPRLPV